MDFFFRLDEGNFKIEDIDPTLCTHGFYGFADINNEVS
jgi:GH18 family chitinase